VRNLIFSYATEYYHKHDSIAPAKKFALTDNEYEDYVAYLQDKFLDYQTEDEFTVQKLKDIATREKYMEDATDEFKALQTKLSHDRFKDLELFKSDIKELLEEEITARYYYNAGRIANTMRKDSQILSAVTMLKTPEKYAETLNMK
jgi:carboxyl-terminal processing protease